MNMKKHPVEERSFLRWLWYAVGSVDKLPTQDKYPIII